MTSQSNNPPTPGITFTDDEDRGLFFQPGTPTKIAIAAGGQVLTSGNYRIIGGSKSSAKKKKRKRGTAQRKVEKLRKQLEEQRKNGKICAAPSYSGTRPRFDADALNQIARWAVQQLPLLFAENKEEGKILQLGYSNWLYKRTRDMRITMAILIQRHLAAYNWNTVYVLYRVYFKQNAFDPTEHDLIVAFREPVFGDMVKPGVFEDLVERFLKDIDPITLCVRDRSYLHSAIGRNDIWDGPMPVNDSAVGGKDKPKGNYIPPYKWNAAVSTGRILMSQKSHRR